jgi:hypothetical protein
MLNVYLHQTTKKTTLGTLATINNKIYFEYAKEFLKTGIEISPYKLPIKSGVIECKGEKLDMTHLKQLAKEISFNQKMIKELERRFLKI